jgi:hypothetical protein
MAVPSSRPTVQWRGLVAVLFLAASVTLGLAFGAAVAESRRGTSAARTDTGRPSQIPTDDYVSSERCQACHPSEYDSWHASFHRTMTQVATPAAVRANFDGTQVAAVIGRPMQLTRRGEEFWADFDDPEWDGEGAAPARISRQVLMITGSHHQQVYWYSTGRGRELGQLPATFLIGEERWVPREMVFLRPPVGRPRSTSGDWNARCINCHATHGKPLVRAGAAGETATNVAELGIACEACHGPANRHAQANRNPLLRYASHLTDRPDATIVQPTRLNPRTSSLVCGQCHGVWMHEKANEARANVAGLSFRPGDGDARHRILVRPSVNGQSAEVRELLLREPDAIESVFWSDGMIRVSGREYNGLVDSPCFAQATEPGRTMTCFSCHSMHKDGATDRRDLNTWASTHQVSPGKESNQACLQCHAPIGKDLRAHTNHAPESTGSSCYNCHMPYTTWGLLKALRSHQISSPSVDASVRTGRPNACNACHLDKTLAWTADKLQGWYGVPSAPLPAEEQSIAASLLWSIRGDAGQRALMAWMMGWKPAQEASGTQWLPAYLAGLLDDPYDAVRLVAYRSTRTVPGFENFRGDFLAPPATRQRDVAQIIRSWRSMGTSRRRTDAELLFNPDGSVKLEIVQRLLLVRNHRPVSLNE